MVRQVTLYPKAAALSSFLAMGCNPLPEGFNVSSLRATLSSDQ
jgi:hypothetical protein